MDGSSVADHHDGVVELFALADGVGADNHQSSPKKSISLLSPPRSGGVTQWVQRERTSLAVVKDALLCPQSLTAEALVKESV